MQQQSKDQLTKLDSNESKLIEQSDSLESNLITLGIVGSRDGIANQDIDLAINEGLLKMNLSVHDISKVISGGASGVDAYAIDWAMVNELPYEIYAANWYDFSVPKVFIKTNKQGNRYNALAGFNRNQLIAEDCTHLIAIMRKDNPTPGTTDTISRFKKLGKLPIVIEVE